MRVKALVASETWSVERVAKIEEVILHSGATRFRVQVSDLGRKPFITKWFNDPTPASDFVDRIKAGFDPREDKG